ncbi:hypothetical protein ON010_g15847 [Phytophthora cinnamomi]|nr:hypothetical protein ON010_g15847 [Phytophthora cinnamomi]
MWDEYPNGRWGNSESPAFGELTESHFAPSSTSTPNERRAMWGEAPAAKEDVRRTFVQYVRGEISSLPWCDAALHAETSTVQQELAAANSAGFLTINSQPRVNGALSDDPMFGWGGPGGRVYQKAYVECFVSPENMKIIIENAAKKPSQVGYCRDVGGIPQQGDPAAHDRGQQQLPGVEGRGVRAVAQALGVAVRGRQPVGQAAARDPRHVLPGEHRGQRLRERQHLGPVRGPGLPRQLALTKMKEEIGVPRVCARELRGHHGPVNAVRFNSTGTYVMTCGQDKTVKLWNPHRDGVDKPNEALLIKTYEGRHGYDVQDVAMYGECTLERKLVVGCDEWMGVVLIAVRTTTPSSPRVGETETSSCGTCRLHRLFASLKATSMARNAYMPIQVLDDFKDSVMSMVVTEHEIIAGCVDGVMRTYDLRAGQLFREHIDEPVVSVAHSPDSRFLLAGCLDGSIRLVEKTNGTEVKR